MEKKLYIKPMTEQISLIMDKLMIPASPGVVGPAPSKPSVDWDFPEEEEEEAEENFSSFKPWT